MCVMRAIACRVSCECVWPAAATEIFLQHSRRAVRNYVSPSALGRVFSRGHAILVAHGKQLVHFSADRMRNAMQRE